MKKYILKKESLDQIVMTDLDGKKPFTDRIVNDKGETEIVQLNWRAFFKMILLVEVADAPASTMRLKNTFEIIDALKDVESDLSLTADQFNFLKTWCTKGGDTDGRYRQGVPLLNLSLLKNIIDFFDECESENI